MRSRCACHFCAQNTIDLPCARLRAHSASSTADLSAAAAPFRRSTSCRSVEGACETGSAARRTGAERLSVMRSCTLEVMVAEKRSVWRLRGASLSSCWICTHIG